ncbi:MAG: cytochrome C biogenesis protein CcsA, partial [Mariprofundaceae bacterium]|nr:cytochrome C biogenesis protein CcsA [Mariprofundaceae bacterium]
SYGCVACHQGANVGGNLFQKMGVFKSYFDPYAAEESDLGRFSITGKEADKYVFKVPSLRLVVLTAPYFHNGGVKTLHKAIKIMGYYQLGIHIPDDDVKLIIEFLQTLVGKRYE